MTAKGELEEGKYTLTIAAHERKLILYFSSEFPYTIEGWEEHYTSKGNAYSSIAKRIHTERRQYWREKQQGFRKFKNTF